MDGFIFFKRVSLLDKLFFTKHLALMVRSGITIVDGLDTLIAQTKTPYFRKVLLSVFADIQNGQRLADALSKHPKEFDVFYISLIQVGEQSGSLDTSLEYLAKQIAKQYSLTKKIEGVMLYPLLILTIATAIAGFISYFILPQLTSFFTSLDVKLPLSTRILLFVADLMKHYGILIWVGFGLLLLALYLILGLPSVKKHWQKFLLSLPVLGAFQESAILATLCRNLGIMLKSGLSITTSLETLRDGTANLVFKEYIGQIHKAVIRGRNISEELTSGNYHFIPPIVTRMITIGEKSGELDQTLLYLGDFFEDDVDNSAKNVSTLIEPLLLIGIGIVVGFLALAIITPIYQLTGSIQRK